MAHIKRSTSADLLDISQCYAACFPNSMAVALGNKTVSKSLEWFLVAENRFLIHLVHDDKVVGFVGGFAPQFVGDGGKSGMLGYSAKTVIGAILTKPYLMLRKDVLKYIPVFIKNRWLRFVNSTEKTKKIDTTAYTKKVLISTIGVHPGYRKQGYGKKMLQESEVYARQYDRKELLLSVKRNNANAISFYHQTGWCNAGSLKDSFQLSKKLQ